MDRFYALTTSLLKKSEKLLTKNSSSNITRQMTTQLPSKSLFYWGFKWFEIELILLKTHSNLPQNSFFLKTVGNPVRI